MDNYISREATIAFTYLCHGSSLLVGIGPTHFTNHDTALKNVGNNHTLNPAGCDNLWYPSENLALEPREVSFVRNLFIYDPIVLKFCTEHGSITAVLFARFQNNWFTKMGVIGERGLARFEFKVSGRYPTLQQPTEYTAHNSLVHVRYGTSILSVREKRRCYNGTPLWFSVCVF